jgi:aryl-alcohol dehydrogenase-like predicted oxidoreductase
MDDLVREGKVRVKGQSAYSYEDFARAVPIVRPAVLQSWANALDDRFIRPGSPVSDLMRENNITFVAFSPLAQGLMLDKFDPQKPPQFEPGDHRKDSPRFQTENLLKLKPKLQRLKERFGATTEQLAAVAERYVLNMPHVSCVIPGFRNEKQVACNLAGADLRLSDEDVAYIQSALADS